MEEDAPRIWIVVGEDRHGKWEVIVPHAEELDAQSFATSIFNEHDTVTIMESILW